MMLPGSQAQPVNAGRPSQPAGAETEPDLKQSLREPSQTAAVAQPPAAHVPDKDSSKAPSPEPANPPPAAPGREEGKTDAAGEPQKSVHQSVDFDDDQQQEGSASFNRLNRVPSKKDDDQVLQESAAADEHDMDEQEKKLADKHLAYQE